MQSPHAVVGDGDSLGDYRHTDAGIVNGAAKIDKRVDHLHVLSKHGGIDGGWDSSCSLNFRFRSVYF